MKEWSVKIEHEKQNINHGQLLRLLKEIQERIEELELIGTRKHGQR